MSDLTKKAQERINKLKGFITSNNYNVIKVEEGYCELEGLITETSINPMGNLHGGYIFGLADTAGGIAAMKEDKSLVTISANIDYLKISKGNKLKAIAKCIKEGKNISFVDIYIYDLEENLIAKSTINYFYL